MYVKTKNWRYTCSEVLTKSSAAFIPPNYIKIIDDVGFPN